MGWLQCTLGLDISQVSGLTINLIGHMYLFIYFVSRPCSFTCGTVLPHCLHFLPTHSGLKKKSHFNTLDFLFHPDNYTIILPHSKNPSRGNWCVGVGVTQKPLRHGSRGTNTDKSSRKREGKSCTYSILISPLCKHLNSLHQTPGLQPCH